MTEDGSSVSREKLEAIVTTCDGRPPLTDLGDLFTDSENNSCSVEDFEYWVLKHADLASFTEWLLGEGCTDDGQGFQLEAEPDPPTFYQTLSKIYQCKLKSEGGGRGGREGERDDELVVFPVSVSEKDIMDIEKTYWGLKGGSGKFDEDVFRPYVTPSVPDDTVADLFRAIDINKDGHIDLSEMIQLIAASCKRTQLDGHKCLCVNRVVSLT